ncbi:MAG: MarR family transcriptional regulator [Paenibacillus macerans]|uniref:MarR family protein n=1 Tax=Paenibacillus macerans TaxID=44252 RepID=A0A090ZIT7_PAEMA|nr:MarR family transcriptional regulator [Paenibacillus macerans]KFN11259.1 marR family protein [Paenibacillus macerans]MCY7561535.1 MarR family transcriptional regulator [Paenibacillus macerans]MDU7474663.1 MarR family transcriptional regulator [Paenibacillus macerans]MEC0152765.1 MarR family transcriptional regulator [Paenibacillus macerans]MEC0333651.1 MarR family transcriptional regulator [Paenibacillus macerans]
MRRKIEQDYSKEQQLPRLGISPYLELMKKSVSSDLTEKAHIGLLLLWISDNIQDLVDLKLEPYGITESKLDLLLLLTLHSNDKAASPTPSALASRLGIRRASATALLDWLEKRNWVKRTVNTDNRRMVHVEITEEGRRLVRQVLPEFWTVLASLMSDMTHEEQQVLLKLFGKMNTSLEKRLGVGR